MLPGVYEFSWTAGHVIFVAFFISAILVVAGYAAFSILRAHHDQRRGAAGELRWHETFEMLPSSRCVCRHELDREGDARLCHRGFDCEGCERHQQLATESEPLSAPVTVHGLAVEPDELYDRGHTTVRPVEDDLVEVFPDALARRILHGCRVEPAATDDDSLARGDAVFRVESDRGPLRLLTPVEGEVVGVHERDGLPALRIRPRRPLAEQTHLLRGGEAVRWLESELRLVQRAMSPGEAAPTLADGGEIREDLVRVTPDVDWDQLREELLLDV